MTHILSALHKKINFTSFPTALSFSLTKLELCFGSLGSLVTRILYTVSVNDVASFPLNDPAPDVTSAVANVNAVTVYDDDTVEPVRFENHFSVPLAGELVFAVKADIETAIRSAWAADRKY